MNPKKTKKQGEVNISDDQMFETIQDLGTALFLRTNFLRCPVCRNTILSGGPHNESCRFNVIEKLAQNLGAEVLKENLKAFKV